MSAKMHMLKVVVSERLTQVAEEICSLVEKILLEYEQDLYREITPQMDLHLHTTTTDVSLQRFTGLVLEESCDDSPKQNHNISDPEEALLRPEPSIKEEQEDEWSAGFEDPEPQALPQRHEKDTEVIEFIYSPVFKSEQLNTEPVALSDTEAQYTTPPPEDAVPCTSTEPCGAAVTAVLCLPADFQTFTEAANVISGGCRRISAPELAADGHCMVCKVSFSNRSNLMNHAKIHGDDCVRKCGICGKRLPTRECLLDHLKTHAHWCECCGKTFRRPADLSVHMCCHTGQKPFTCRACGKGFSRKRDMEIHKRTHTDEKPYRCSVCGKCFRIASGLIRHSRSHSVPHYERL